ncbi:hypothetical protein E2562_026662, partial [Oryza meyeriana var. granulata]
MLKPIVLKKIALGINKSRCKEHPVPNLKKVQYGKGNWKDIKMAYPDVFEDRSTVDLKDKFRNMERH